jgi:hypothetical protein
MNDTLVLLKTAYLAKEKGFKGGLHYDGVGGYFTNTTQSLLQRWLREKHNIQIEISLYHMHGGWVGAKYQYQIYTIYQSEEEWDKGNEYGMEKCHHPKNSSNTYEQALEAGLIEALKLITYRGFA